MLWRKLKRTRIPQRNRQKRFRYKKLFFVIMIIFLLTTAGYGLYQSKVLNIKSVEVRKTNISCATEQEIKDNLAIEGLNIFFIDTPILERKITTKFLCVNTVKLTKHFPGKIVIEVDGRAPVFIATVFKTRESSGSASLISLLEQIASPSAEASGSAKVSMEEGKSFLINSDGGIFAGDTNMDYPKVSFVDFDFIVGQRIDLNLVKQILTIFDKLKVLNVKFDDVRVYPTSDVVINSDHLIVLNIKEDVQKQLASLQLILEKAKIDNEELILVDLRFDKPIIRYGKKKGNK